MVHFVQIISAAALVSVASAVPMGRRYAPTSSMSAYSTYQTSAAQASSNYGSMDSSYGSTDSSYASMDSSMDSSYGSLDSSYDSSYGGMDSSMDSSYGSSDSSYGNTWNSMSSETLMDVMTSTSSSSYSVATQTASAMSSSVTYGSGSTSWGSSGGYDSCVQQCMAQFGTPPPTVTSSSPSEEVSSTSTSSGASVTHTIIVAPSQGVLKYIPFATNASVGDTIEFSWGAGPHTVTQSSAVEVCNKTANGFASGSREAGSLFDQTINNTNPIWFYCGIPGHCEKGMFGGVNIGNPVLGSSSDSNSSYMPMSSALSELANDSDVSAAWNYTKGVVASGSSLSNWGMDINCAGLSDDNKKSAVLNVLYSQAVMAMNPDTFQNGKVVGSANASALKLPEQFATQTNTTQPAASQTSAVTNGVESLLAPRYFVALAAIAASLALF